MERYTQLKLKLNDNVKFIHHDRVTVARLTVDLVNNKYDTLPFPGWFVLGMSSAPIVVTGVSRAHEEDQYDQEIGEKIALSKARIKALKIIKKKLEKSGDYVAQLLREHYEATLKTFNCLQTELKYLNKLSNK